MRNHYRTLSLLGMTVLMLSAAVFALSACKGLPLSGTTDRSLSREERLGIVEIQIEVLVLSHTGHTVAGLDVSIETSQNTDVDTTNSEGIAVLTVLLSEIDAIEFFFKGNGIDWTETIHDFPKGEPHVRATFIVDKIGRARLKTFEF